MLSVKHGYGRVKATKIQTETLPPQTFSIRLDAFSREPYAVISKVSRSISWMRRSAILQAQRSPRPGS